jgi:hypothetical protein
MANSRDVHVVGVRSKDSYGNDARRPDTEH